MKLKLYSTFFIATCILLLSCKTASKLYEKGNYDEAVELAAKKLQKDPDDPKLLDIIRNAYDYAINDHESRIRNYGLSSNDLKWEWIYNEYVSLQRLYDAIYRVPSVFDIVKPVDYSSYVITYREKAGNNRYERGIAFMQRYDKQSYRNAYREFQAALRFLPGDIGTIQKLDEAYEYAVTNIIVLPMQQNGGFVYSSYSPGSQNFDDQLLSSLQYNSGSEFIKFYSAWDARSRNIRADEYLEMQLISLNIGGYQDTKSTRRVSNEVVVKETVYKPDSVVKEYRKVYAEITTTNRNIYSDALLKVTLRNEKGVREWTDNFSSSHHWGTQFTNYKGDSRALSETDLQLVNRKPQFAPSENEITKNLLDDIKSNAIYRIRNYVSRI